MKAVFLLAAISRVSPLASIALPVLPKTSLVSRFPLLSKMSYFLRCCFTNISSNLAPFGLYGKIELVLAGEKDNFADFVQERW